MESGNSSGKATGTPASTSARAQELRANLGARRDVEVLLAEASAARQAAAADADAIVEEAQQLSEQLVAESNAEAERTTSHARERAESVLTRARTDAEDITRQARAAADAVRSRAEAEVEEHRRRVRAEVTEQVTREVTEGNRNELAALRQQSGQMIGDLEASVRILGVSLQAALANTGEMLAALEGLRAHTVETLGALDPSPAPDSVPGEVPIRPAIADVHDLDEVEEVAVVAVVDEPDEPDEAGPIASADDEIALGEVAGVVLPVADDQDEDPPLTATEAFLRSSHLDHGDPPLPPMDDTEVGNRYNRDAATRARTRPRRERPADPETLDVVPAKERVRDLLESPDERENEAAGRPLGWLFRSSP